MTEADEVLIAKAVAAAVVPAGMGRLVSDSGKHARAAVEIEFVFQGV